MYIDHDRVLFSPFSNQAPLLRRFVRTLCFFVFIAVMVAYLALFAASWGDIASLSSLYATVTALFLVVALGEVSTAWVKSFRTLAPKGLYLVFLVLVMLMAASLFDKATGLAAVIALVVLGISVYIYKTDPFFRSTVIDELELEEEESSYEGFFPRSDVSVRRSAKRKRRKNRIRR